jgi:hypothetical protein
LDPDLFSFENIPHPDPPVLVLLRICEFQCRYRIDADTINTQFYRTTFFAGTLRYRVPLSAMQPRIPELYCAVTDFAHQQLLSHFKVSK